MAVMAAGTFGCSNSVNDSSMAGWWLVSGPWNVVEEADRARWSLDPLEGVGPLRFGMMHDDVVEALDGLLEPSWKRMHHYGEVLSDEFSLVRPPGLTLPALTVFYDRERLVCVVVNALRGPQVSLDGLPLVGRVPSELDREFVEYLAARGHVRRFSQFGDTCSVDVKSVSGSGLVRVG